ncbi:MAG: PD-(D/E)XK nuclease family protein [Candidatus Nanohaloarchaea archaeon]
MERPLKRKDMDQIFSEVKEYDLVLTVDAPLADALNSRLESSRVGGFAETPRRYAFEGEGEINFKRDTFLKIIEQTDLSWKQTSFILENTIEAWQETGNIYQILESSRFTGEAAEKIINILEKTENPLTALEETRIPEDKDVAVLAPYQFNELDKKILPEEYDEKSIFTEEEFELPCFNVFSSAGEIVEALKNSIDRKNADQVALVVDPDSKYQSLIKAGLNLEGIPFNSTKTFSEKEDVRTFIALARLSLADERVKVRDIRPVIDHLGLEVSKSKNNVLLSEIEEKKLEEFAEFLNVANLMTFEEFISGYEDLVRTSTGRIREIVEDLGLVERELSEKAISRLEYYLDSFDPADESTDNGVLLASPRSTIYIDRPVVFYIGMGADWTQEVAQRPWINRERKQEENLKDFNALIQNGEEKYYMVQEREMNEQIAPCFYFTELYDLERFSEHDTRHFSTQARSSLKGFKKRKTNVEFQEVETISQSSLNRFVESPKAYYFSKLVSDTEKDVMVKGNLFHDFAEFYVNFPEQVKEKGLESFIEIMKKEINPYIDDIGVERLETEFRVGVRNIKAFIDSREFQEVDVESGDGFGSNTFAEYFDRELDESIAELSFNDREIHAKGKIDLVLGDEIVDYKSSSRIKTRKQIVRDANIDLYDERPDFQPVMYLLEMSKNLPDQKLEFTYFYPVSDIATDITSGSALEEKTVTVTYYPETFQEKVKDTEVFEKLIKDVAKSNDRRKTLEKLGHHRFEEFFDRKSIPVEYDKERLLESEFAAEFIDYVKQEVGDYKYVEKGAKKALKKLVEFRKTSFFKEDLDRFEEFLEEKVDELNTYKQKGFPRGEQDLDQNPYRDMIVE